MEKSMILRNQRGQNGQKTSAVVLVKDFMNAVFNIEKKFHTQEKYTVAENADSKEYLLHHVTNADLQLALILQKVCDLKGSIRNVLPYDIYRKMVEYFEVPVVESQFYASLTKFEKHNLIEKTKDTYTNRYTFVLQHYIKPEKDTVDFYALVSPLVFSEAFQKLELAKKKLFFSVYIQQQTTSQVDRLLQNTQAEDVQFSGLLSFLHRDSSQISRILRDLCAEPFFRDKPLLKRAELLKYRGKFHKATLAVNPALFIKGKGEKYHDLITCRASYPRVTKLLTSLLNTAGLGEVASVDRGDVLNQLVGILKQAGIRVIHYVVSRLKEFVAENKTLPYNIPGFVRNEAKHKTKAAILGIVRKYQLQQFVAPFCSSRVEKQNREEEFASVMSYLPLREIDVLCKAASAKLHAHFIRPAIRVTYDDYKIPTGLHHHSDIVALRYHAYAQKKDPQEYVQLELQASEKATEMGVEEFREWVLDQIDMLPEITSVPAVARNFKLEDYALSLA